jgi:hypothetical protein
MKHIYLPTLHSGQVEIFNGRTNLNAVKCGRRYGKTKMMVTLASNYAAKGEKVGIFTPTYKQLKEPYSEIQEILQPIVYTSNKTDGEIIVQSRKPGRVTRGKVDFWTLIDNELAGRGREYDHVFLDEGAFNKRGQMMDIWDKSIKPTMLTTKGKTWVFSTPNGIADDEFFYQICHDPKYGFKVFHAPSVANPYVDPAEIEKKRLTEDPLVFRQEYLAEFVDWSGVQFFSLDKLLDNGLPIDVPNKIDAVFVTIDTAVKTGKENDGTAVIYWGINKFVGHPLIVLDWDIIQIEGSLLETWLPTVFQNLEAFAKQHNARLGSLGAHIEDKASGTILIQQAQRRGWMAEAIDSVLTSVGKDERCISVSGYVYRGMVKLSKQAFDKVVTYKGHTRNQFLAQVLGFKIGVKDQVDDLVDCFTYGIAIALGNHEGF